MLRSISTVVAALTLAAAAFAQVTDLNGPIAHEVRVALPDGDEGFRDSGALLWDHASVPGGVLAPDGRLLIYYVNAYDGGLWLAESRDHGGTFRFGPVAFADDPSRAAVDPCALAGEDGSTVLYFLESFTDPSGARGNRVRRATSADGLTFAADPDPCCIGARITDPDVYRLSDGRWVMHVSEGATIWRAFSRDGLHFAWEGPTPIGTQGAVTATVEHAPGEWRLYFSGRGGIRYYASRDGLDWSRDARAAVSSQGAADPCPIRMADGWRVYYKRVKPGARPGLVPPSEGPGAHRVISAFSPDLAEWQFEPGIRLPMASVEAPIMLPDGRTLLYYVDAVAPSLGFVETANVAVSEDGLRFQALGLTIAGSPWTKALDPSPLLLPDGRIRLYYYGCSGDPSAEGDHVVASAIGTDGVHFTYEGECLRLPGLVDPDVWFDGTTYRMLVFAGERTIVAESTDGLGFRRTGTFPYAGWATTRPERLGEGAWSLFAFEQFVAGEVGNAVRRFASEDGALWRAVPGDLLRAPSGWQLTDPHVVRCPGGYRMYLKAESRGPR